MNNIKFTVLDFNLYKKNIKNMKKEGFLGIKSTNQVKSMQKWVPLDSLFYYGSNDIGFKQL